MKKFAIVSDSCCDLAKSLREKYDIDYILMHFTIDGEEYPADLDWEKLSIKEFYDSFRQNKKYKTAQVSEAQYEERFRYYLDRGYDVLSISCSSGLSSSVKTSYIARDRLQKEYPDSKIICIDPLISGYGLGMICIIASRMRAEGKTIDEIADWIETNKKRFNQEGAVESLTYLKRAGRVSAVSAFFGGILSVKPIIVADELGRNVAIEKVKGRKASLIRLAERIADEIEVDECNEVYVAHADCPEAAEEVKGYLKEKINDERVEYFVSDLGPIVGGSSGPGTIIVYCFGKDTRKAAE